MSGHGFHVHGPHDHELEHAAHSNDDFSSKIAVMTAIMATVGALIGYEGGATQNQAAMLKNSAAITKTNAANSWNHYQAKSNKQNLAELALSIPGVEAEKYKSDIERYKKEKENLKKEAEAFEKQVVELEDSSEAALHQHHRWAQSMTAVQIAISLAAIALLTKKKWLEYGSYAVATAGIGIAALAWMHI